MRAHERNSATRLPQDNCQRVNYPGAEAEVKKWWTWRREEGGEQRKSDSRSSDVGMRQAALRQSNVIPCALLASPC